MNILDTYNKIQELQRRLETVPDAVYECVQYNQDEILDLRKDELLLGRNSDGQPFTPGYTEDPWFNDITSLQWYHDAEGYHQMKIGLEKSHNMMIRHPLNYPDKGDNTPNLIITGKFHSMMFTRVDRESLIISSTFEDTDDINAKYHNKVMNLGPGAKEYFWKWLLFPALYNHIWR